MPGKGAGFLASGLILCGVARGADKGRHVQIKIKDICWQGKGGPWKSKEWKIVPGSLAVFETRMLE